MNRVKDKKVGEYIPICQTVYFFFFADMDCIIEFLFILLATHFDEIAGQLPVHRRFEYKHSFRAPDLAQRDGSIPFWTIAGDAIASNEQLRVAPSMRSRKGLVNFLKFSICYVLGDI